MRIQWIGLALLVAAERSGGCGSTSSLPAGETTARTIAAKMIGGEERTYHLTLPAGYAKDTAYPVLMGLHGWGLSGSDYLWYDGAVREAKAGRAVVIHPDGSKAGSPYRGWNAVGSSMTSGATNTSCVPSITEGDFPCYASCGKCNRCSWSSCTDDVAFVEAMLDAVEAELCVDTSQVRVHGESNGGMMVFELLQSRAAHRFSAMVSTIALPEAGRQRLPTSPTRFLGLWGEYDPIMPPGYATDDVSLMTTSNDGFYYSSAANSTATLATAFKCGQKIVPWPLVDQLGFSDLTCVHYPGCRYPAEVVHCHFPGKHDTYKHAPELIAAFYASAAAPPTLLMPPVLPNVRAAFLQPTATVRRQT